MSTIRELNRIYQVLGKRQGIIVKKSFEKINQNPLKDFKLETIEAYPHKEALARVLSELSATVTGMAFGNQVLIWTWKNYRGQDEERYRKMVSIRTGESESYLKSLKK